MARTFDILNLFISNLINYALVWPIGQQWAEGDHKMISKLIKSAAKHSVGVYLEHSGATKGFYYKVYEVIEVI